MKMPPRIRMWIYDFRMFIWLLECRIFGHHAVTQTLEKGCWCDVRYFAFYRDAVRYAGKLSRFGGTHRARRLPYIENERSTVKAVKREVKVKMDKIITVSLVLSLWVIVSLLLLGAISITLPIRKSTGHYAASLAPEYGRCGRCGMPWKFAQSHNTYFPFVDIPKSMPPNTGVIFGYQRGVFPLCELCWEELGDPKHRLPYYKRLWELWHKDSPTKTTDLKEWEQIKAAVEQGG